MTVDETLTALRLTVDGTMRDPGPYQGWGSVFLPEARDRLYTRTTGQRSPRVCSVEFHANLAVLQARGDYAPMRDDGQALFGFVRPLT